MLIRLIRCFAVTAGLLALSAPPTLAANCGSTAAGFDAWLADFRNEAVAAGISLRAVNAGLSGLAYAADIIRLDRNQRHFKQSFEVFYRNHVTGGRMSRARSMLRSKAGLFSRIEQRFGVPGEVVVAIWALETDFGANRGNSLAIRSLATLAYDCRRSAFFKNELLNALRIVQRGDMTPSQMRGGWAGEIGQTQFMPSAVVKFAVDFDGNGRRDLVRSQADVLASTANYLRGYGWQAGEPWGPGTANFSALQGWNKSTVYSRTIAVFAQKLAGVGTR